MNICKNYEIKNCLRIEKLLHEFFIMTFHFGFIIKIIFNNFYNNKSMKNIVTLFLIVGVAYASVNITNFNQNW